MKLTFCGSTIGFSRNMIANFLKVLSWKYHEIAVSAIKISSKSGIYQFHRALFCGVILLGLQKSLRSAWPKSITVNMLST